jgi:hypothetical protein
MTFIFHRSHQCGKKHENHREGILMKRLLTLCLALVLLLPLPSALAAKPQLAPSQWVSQGPELALEVLQKSDALRQAILTSETAIGKDKKLVPGETYSKKAYYVSPQGDDKQDGRSPETAWATLAKVNKARLGAGDAVFFCRGGEWYGQLKAKKGVTYSAYGTGAKPIFYGTSLCANDPADWHPLTGTSNIWIYATRLPDCGGIVLDGGRAVGVRILPTPRPIPRGDGAYTWMKPDRPNVNFKVAEDLASNLAYFSAVGVFSKQPTTGAEQREDQGFLYLRCDEGNPAQVYGEVRLMLWGNTLLPAANAVFDNLCVRYAGSQGLYAPGLRLTVQNCEFGWIGGCVGYYREGTQPVRFGNALENDGSCSLYTVRGNYIHDVYGAGMRSHSRKVMDSILYEGNLLEYCHQGIDLSCQQPKNSRGKTGLYRDTLIRNNLILMSGYGLGSENPDQSDAAIQGYDAPSSFENCVLQDNLLYLAQTSLLTLAAAEGREPQLLGNMYLQSLSAPSLFRWKGAGYDPDTPGAAQKLRELDPTGTLTVLQDAPKPRE